MQRGEGGKGRGPAGVPDGLGSPSARSPPPLPPPLCPSPPFCPRPRLPPRPWVAPVVGSVRAAAACGRLRSSRAARRSPPFNRAAANLGLGTPQTRPRTSSARSRRRAFSLPAKGVAAGRSLWAFPFSLLPLACPRVGGPICSLPWATLPVNWSLRSGALRLFAVVRGLLPVAGELWSVPCSMWAAPSRLPPLF